MGYRLLGRKESDTTEQLTFSLSPAGKGNGSIPELGVLGWNTQVISLTSSPTPI